MAPYGKKQTAPREIHFVENETAFELEINVLQKRGLRDFTMNGAGFVRSAFRKGRAEVSEQQLTPSQLKELIAAKKENVALQLESAYRSRINEAYQQVKKHLDYQLELANRNRNT